MEYTDPEETFIPLDPEIETKIRTTIEHVASASDLEEALHWARLLDMELAEDELVGAHVVVESDAMVWKQSRLKADSQVEFSPVVDPELLKSRYITGVFAGTDVLEVQGARELMYNIDVGEKGGYDVSVMTPAYQSILAMQPSETGLSSPEETIIHFMTLLRTIRDEHFREDLNELELAIASLAEPGAAFDADFMRELGVIATDLLSHEKVKQSQEMTHAVLEVLASLISRGEFIVMEGDEFSVYPDERNGEGGKKVVITQIRYSGTIIGVGTVSNYDYAPDDDSLPLLDDLKQPAIVFDADGMRHSVPLKFLTLFLLQRRVSETKLCHEGRTRFLEAYPVSSWASSQ